MTNTTHDADHDTDHDHDAVPVTDHVHHNSWSANLERAEHADSRDLVVDQAIDAIEHTAAGNHVNLVTHGDHGHPAEYLFDELEAAFDGRDLAWEYIEQCGCGGHVVRVQVPAGANHA
ncbi:putative rSAM target protein, CGCGG family [Halopenitus malekzadehii]|uniref:Putative rSAM target protein, CGCGG family n=1 Tax=Halopenitus malekzadehii TaxID=1267564 RepID=A0A1H6IB74_9EURY|nr:CGCGG family rSAM-modified RiPP protein [Halopenitus malekzadehii]SEH46029.1 putative rSAM target protein, CGCGG family [Halopenitus malekzadehii]